MKNENTDVCRAATGINTEMNVTIRSKTMTHHDTLATMMRTSIAGDKNSSRRKGTEIRGDRKRINRSEATTAEVMITKNTRLSHSDVSSASEHIRPRDVCDTNEPPTGYRYSRETLREFPTSLARRKRECI